MIFSFLFFVFIYSMPDFSSSKTQNPRCRQRQRGFLKQRKERTRRRIRLMSRKELSFSLTYIVYQIFWLVQIFVGFFAAAGGRALPVILFYGQNFCKKISRAKHAQPNDASWKKHLLPHIKYNIKPVKLQELNCIYSIPYFPQNTTAKPQNLPATAPFRFVLTGSASGKYIGSRTTLLPTKKRRRFRGASGFRAKILV